MDLEPKKKSRLDTPVGVVEVTRLGHVQVQKTPRAILSDYLSGRGAYDQAQLMNVFALILQDLVEKSEEASKKVVLN